MRRIKAGVITNGQLTADFEHHMYMYIDNKIGDSNKMDYKQWKRNLSIKTCIAKIDLYTIRSMHFYLDGP